MYYIYMEQHLAYSFTPALPYIYIKVVYLAADCLAYHPYLVMYTYIIPGLASCLYQPTYLYTWMLFAWPSTST